MPVILAKTTLGSVKIKDFKLLIFGYFLNVMLSKSLFDLAKFFFVKKFFFPLKYDGFESTSIL